MSRGALVYIVRSLSNKKTFRPAANFPCLEAQKLLRRSDFLGENTNSHLKSCQFSLAPNAKTSLINFSQNTLNSHT
jgi:hypothetical protein